VFLLPTATDDALGTGQWGAGPTAVGLRQRGPWTYGLLANHLWSFAGEGGRPDVNQTYLPPGGRYYGCRHCYNLTYQSCQENDQRVSFLRKYPKAVMALFEGAIEDFPSSAYWQRVMARWGNQKPGCESWPRP
jgi:hypothetical protein